MPAPGEELWVIERPAASEVPPPGEVSPGSGELRAKVPGEEREIPLPLKHTDVKATISGTIATVWVKFPMVVGPRFNPPGSTDGVGAVARGTRGLSGQKTEVECLRPNERSGHDIALAVDIDAGVAIEKVFSPSHAIERKTISANRVKVELTPHDRVPNKDFVLRYRVAGKQVKTALDFPHDDQRFRIVSFMTDGYIGNEAQILGEVHKRLGASRIFSFGVGSSPNRYLLERMALIGRGAVAYVGLDGDSGVHAVDQFYDRIRHAALADIRIDWGGMNVSDVYPQRVPDLFVGRPVILTGRFKGKGEGVVRVKGTASGMRREIPLTVNLDAAASHPGVPLVWARTYIADLANRATYSRDADELAQQIEDVALEYGLMSAYTAFVAVDSLTRTAGDHGITVRVPVPVPEGVRYETTVRERHERP